MAYQWIHESPPTWDSAKETLLGGTPAGSFDLGRPEAGNLLPGEWWRLEEDGAVTGYGWMDCTWGDAEILLAVAAGRQNRGAGSYILDRLEAEAAERGLNYLYNQVPPTHPDPAGITRWLERRRFRAAGGERLLRRQVRRSASSPD